MDQILAEMKNWPWRYADKDDDAVRALQRADGEKAVEFWVRELEKAHVFYTANSSVL